MAKPPDSPANAIYRFAKLAGQPLFPSFGLSCEGANLLCGDCQSFLLECSQQQNQPI
jgi:hypothetical protein